MEQAQGILEGLDERQRTAATTLQGPVRIIAGAGAGKTRTVTRRIAYACATGAWKPERVLAVTFSVKAAAEMRARLGQLGVGGGTGRSGLGAGTAGVTAATFHSAALHQLNSVWADICEAPFPHVIEDQRDVVSRAIIRATARTDADPLTVRDVLAEINWAKISLVAVEDYARACAIAHRQPPAGLDTARFADVYSAYEQEKTSRGEIDFDDILLLVCHIMDGFPEAAAQIRSTIGWLTVDEYQDVSPVQQRLLELWLGERRDLCVVGDASQTIYSFAGAQQRYLLEFERGGNPGQRPAVDVPVTDLRQGNVRTYLADTQQRLREKRLQGGGNVLQQGFPAELHPRLVTAHAPRITAGQDDGKAVVKHFCLAGNRPDRPRANAAPRA